MLRRIPLERPSWRSVLELGEREAWFPLFFDRGLRDDREAMDELMAKGEVVFVHDTIDAQVGDLIKTRHPRQPAFTEADLGDKIHQKLAGTALHDYGRWAFFPWSRRLVHLLPPAEFFELRSDRNRNKITRAEQARLAKIRIGLVGLSVGNAVAVTLALEGLFGELRLADFDHLDLSNMNRIRCSVHDIGINKAVICARQIFEQNPYANVAVYSDGLTRENVASFIDEGGRLDILIDECDSLFAKIKIREEARARRIPVLMETSDRGLLDIERFDLEPERPLLHGLVGDLSSEQADTLPPPARIGLILRVVGQDTMSPRAAASMLELGRTVRAFSQLGSDVTLGGATTSIAVRRLALGLPLASGRVFIDVSKALETIRSPELPRAQGNPRAEKEAAFIREVVHYATMAPSPRNAQPWRFHYSEGALNVELDGSRVGDPEVGKPWALVGIGAALETLQIAALAAGRKAQIELFPDPQAEQLVARLRFTELQGDTAADPLFEQITRRATNYRPGARGNLSPVHAQVLIEAAKNHGARLQICTDRAAIEELALLMGEAERRSCLSPKLHESYFRELRWTAAEARETRDGLDLDCLELSPMDRAVLQIVRSPDVAQVLRAVDGGEAIAMRTTQAVSSCAAVAYLTMAGPAPHSYVRGGQALQQIWLTATALNLAVQPCNSLIELFTRLERCNGAGLDAADISAVMEQRERFARCFKTSLNDAEVMVIRLFQADPPTQRSLRRPVEQVLTVVSPS